MKPKQETRKELNTEQIRCARARAAHGCPVAWLAADLKVTPKTIIEVLEDRDDNRHVVHG